MTRATDFGEDQERSTARTEAPRYASFRVGDRLWFAEEKQPYTVQARSARYLVCSKPFNLRHTVLYCIVDLQERMRAPEDLVFGMGAETREQCERMVARLEAGESGLSRRRSLLLNIRRVSFAPARPGAVDLAVDPSRSSPDSALTPLALPPQQTPAPSKRTFR